MSNRGTRYRHPQCICAGVSFEISDISGCWVHSFRKLTFYFRQTWFPLWKICHQSKHDVNRTCPLVPCFPLSFHSLSSRKHLLIPHALLTCTLFLQQIDQQCRPSSCTKFRVPLRGTELSANLPRRLHATAVSFLAHFLPYSPGRLPVW